MSTYPSQFGLGIATLLYLLSKDDTSWKFLILHILKTELLMVILARLHFWIRKRVVGLTIWFCIIWKFRLSPLLPWWSFVFVYVKVLDQVAIKVITISKTVVLGGITLSWELGLVMSTSCKLCKNLWRLENHKIRNITGRGT